MSKPETPEGRVHRPPAHLQQRVSALSLKSTSSLYLTTFIFSSSPSHPATLNMAYNNNSNYNVGYNDPYAETPYGRPQHETYPSEGTDHPGSAYQVNPSTEKVIDDYPQNTERAQPGRSGIRHGQSKSWAEIGPPPRSTGILRMWRKDERGRQWTRVSTYFWCGHDGG